MSTRRFYVGLLALLAITPALAQAQQPPADVDRLAHLAKLWGTVRYLHPYLAYREIDWDAALVRAIPAVRAAKTPAEYAAAVQSMLGALGDPATHVQPAEPAHPPSSPGGKSPALYRWLDAETLSVHLRPDIESGMDESAVGKDFAALARELPRAKAVIVDLRSPAGMPYYPEYVIQRFADRLTSGPVAAPAQRYLFHSGYRTQLGDSSGSYSSGFQTLLAERFTPPAGASPKRVVFLVNTGTMVPSIAAALQAAGDGAIVSEGRLNDEGLILQRAVDLGEGFLARVRVSEILPRPGWSGPRADAAVSPAAASGGGDPAFEAGLRLVRRGWPPPSQARPEPLPDGVWRPDRSYDEMTEPTLEYRLLAVFKLWNVLHFFFPYLHLTGDWDAVLPEFIARMETAKDGREYVLALAEMGARANDGHVSLTGNPTLDALYGQTPAPVAIRWIENAWVVTEVGEPARSSGVEVGDVVVTLEGEPVATRGAELRRHLAASTEAGMRRKIADRLLSGPPGSTVLLTMRGRGEQIREVRLQRQAWTPQPTGETIRVLPGNLGYVDLGRLTIPEVDGMFEKLKGTRALILDMRGYPHETAWEIAPRLNTRGAVYGALFRRPLVSALESDRSRTGVDFSQPLPERPGPKYKGRTVMLIDERTVSQAEHSGLFFEAANGTKFIGSQTAGADGDVTYFPLPGIASVRFSGHDVRHADGRQLQRIGLVPDVPVAPTIQGIRDGKDEVLDRAVHYLEEELAVPEPAAPAPATPLRIERLTHLAKLWGAVRYLHPYLAYKEIDWDAALVQAIPKVRSAATPEQYAAAVQGMLDVLGDPVTRVNGAHRAELEKLEGTKPETAGAKPPPFRWLDGKTLVIDLRPYADYNGFRALFRELDGMEKEIGKARTVVLDLRPRTSAGGGGQNFQLVLNRLGPFLVHRALRAPTQRYRLYSGYPSQDGITDGIYWSGFVTLAADGFAPPSLGGPDHVAFLVSPRTRLSPIVLALQAAGDGVLVSEGDSGEKAAEEELVVHQTVDLGEGLTAQVRASEPVPLPGWPGVHADARIAPGTGDEGAVRAALAALVARQGNRPAAATPGVTSLPDAVWRPDKTYPEMLDPTLEYRLLAVVRAWNVIHYFYPYKPLIGDWDAVLPEFLARMEEARGARGYAVAVAEMMARVADGHTEVSGHPELTRLYGEAGVAVLPRWIEGKWVVVALGDDPAVRASGLQVGDVIAAVDGEPSEAKVERLRRVIAASNEGGFRETVRRLLLDGPDGSTAVLSIARRDGMDGAAREIRLQRAKQKAWFSPPPPTGEVVRLLPGNLGYVDLTRLAGKDVDAMLETLRNTRGIVFDMRGYPKGVFGRLAPRLNTRNARFAALFRGPEVSAIADEGEEAEAGHVFSQPIYETDRWKYTGKTVMLIDERAISQSEHTGLFLEAANGTKFVGTPTAGADGDATLFTLPGNITVSFTGHDVRHADGRQLQRIGLVPDVRVAPTIQGIREGRDEILDRAVRYLEEELGVTKEPASPGAGGSPATPSGDSGSAGANASW
ncbi:MAG TPA: S41 family peptidase [Thermoanaerobaculia bacterium]|jgi:C-terminal processing protease CtpA/Prc